MYRYPKRHKTPAGTLPICPYCSRPIRYIKRKDGLSAVKVEPAPVMYIPCGDGITTIISPKGSKRKGIIVNDGTMGYIEHICKY